MLAGNAAVLQTVFILTEEQLNDFISQFCCHFEIRKHFTEEIS